VTLITALKSEKQITVPPAVDCEINCAFNFTGSLTELAKCLEDCEKLGEVTPQPSHNKIVPFDDVHKDDCIEKCLDAFATKHDKFVKCLDACHNGDDRTVENEMENDADEVLSLEAISCKDECARYFPVGTPNYRECLKYCKQHQQPIMRKEQNVIEHNVAVKNDPIVNFLKCNANCLNIKNQEECVNCILTCLFEGGSKVKSIKVEMNM
jgi:hypothetical protein